MEKQFKNTLSWISPKIGIKDTKKYGMSIFSKEKINKEEIISIFGGYVMEIKKEEELNSKISDYGLQINENLVLGIKKENEIEPACFFNHSCNPNAGFKGQIFLVAMRDIEKNEEIAFDYAMVLHQSDNAKLYKLKCLCGADNCRGYVTENDWKLPELQKKYDGYFQWYLQEKINKLKKS